MIDTARHYLKKETILRTLKAMRMSKLNVLHIHFTDDESFPLWINSLPYITKTGRYSKN